MRVHKLLVWSTAVGLLEAQSSLAQPRSQELVEIEIEAANAAWVYMPKTPDGRTARALNPRFIAPDVVLPELEGLSARDSAANATIIQASGLVLRPATAVCIGNVCDLGDLAAYLSMSAPRVDADSAVITIHVLTPNDRPKAVFYETYRIALRRETGRWQVRWIDNLGVPGQRAYVSPSPRRPRE